MLVWVCQVDSLMRCSPTTEGRGAMGNPMHRFEMGTPAQRVFMPDLVIGWWRLRPLLTETAPVELPEGLGADDIDLVVDLLQGFRSEERRVGEGCRSRR